MSLILLAIAAADVLAASLLGGALFLLPCAALFVFLSACFGWLQVRDEGEHLAIRYGPLPVFRRKLPYSGMLGVEPARSDWLDGGGVHYVPGRGWIYNLWGRDCVRIQLRGLPIRVGTDDPEGLLAFLETRIGPRRAA